MKTVLKPNQLVFASWGAQKLKDTDYRAIKYLLKKEIDGNLLLHNVVTGELVQLNKREKAMFEKLPHARTSVMQKLIEHHFLVPCDYDEKKAVYSLRKIINLAKSPKEITGYTILPTTGCNARCFYCYEANFKHITMTEQTANDVVKFIIAHCGEEKSVSLSWFGGEPTLCADRIAQICNALKDNDIKYSSSMISNGYLFDEAMVKAAVDIWNLKNIQITLDGTEDIYNKTKAYVGVKTSAFKRVLDNIGLLADNNIRVSIRMNLDKHNAENLRELISLLVERFKDKKNIAAYVHPLFDDCGFDPVKHTEDDRLQLINIQTELNTFISDNGLYFEAKGALPSLKPNYCMADNDASVIIQPNGKLTKCEHTDDADSVGDIYSGITDKENRASWRETIEYDDCNDCVLFPKCVTLKKCFSSTACYEKLREFDLNKYDAQIEKAYRKKHSKQS